MKAPQAVIKKHCDELEYFQRKLCLKDNGTNTEELLFLLRHLERIRVDMLSSEDFDDAIYASRELTNKLQSLKEAGKIESFAVPAAMFIPTDEQQKRINIWKRYWTPERIEKVRHDVVKFGAKHKFSEKVFGQFFRMLEDDYEPNSILDAEVLPEP